MKIQPRNRRKARWFKYNTYGNMNENNVGYIHFEHLDGRINLLAFVPERYAREIISHFIKTEEILYKPYGSIRFTLIDEYDW